MSTALVRPSLTIRWISRSLRIVPRIWKPPNGLLSFGRRKNPNGQERACGKRVEQLKQAAEHKWGTSGWRSQILEMERRAEFYRKIKAALEVAITLCRHSPLTCLRSARRRAVLNGWTVHILDNHDQFPQVLPVGEGRYVNPTPERSSYDINEKQRDGTSKAVTKWYAREFQDVDFPFKS